MSRCSTQPNFLVSETKVDAKSHLFTHHQIMSTSIFRQGLVLGRASSSRSPIGLRSIARSYAVSASQSWDAKPVDLSYDLVEPVKPDADSKGQSLVICHGLLYVLFDHEYCEEGGS